jgi:ABC-type Fe3+-citrate transport system substrate-binding protein
MNVAELVAENEAFRKALVVAEQERDALKKLYEKLTRIAPTVDQMNRAT